MHVVFETERLLLRHFTEADAELTLALDQDPEVTRYTGVGSLVLADHVERIRTVFFASTPGTRARLFRGNREGEWRLPRVVLLPPRDGHKFAALIGWTSDDEIELGYRLRRSAWGRGWRPRGNGANGRRPRDPTVTANRGVRAGHQRRVLPGAGKGRGWYERGPRRYQGSTTRSRCTSRSLADEPISRAAMRSRVCSGRAVGLA